MTIAKARKLASKQNLYRALHWVGDDPCKDEIADALWARFGDKLAKEITATIIKVVDDWR